MDEEYNPDKLTKLDGVWRTCNKIRATAFRIGLNLWDHFKPLDPKNTTFVSESKFINVLGNQLRGTIGLCNEEITELTDYFRIQDGRIAYSQLCQVLHGEVPDNSKNPDLVTGLEWEDPLQVNRLSISENRRLCILLTKIAQAVRLRDLVLRPYFQDYELIAKNYGTVTFTHFYRVLAFMGITLSANDFQILLKRFQKNCYTINYVAFVDEIEKIVKFLDTKRLIDYSQDIVENFPGKLIEVDLPKLPRPEIGKVKISAVFGKEISFHPTLNMPKKDMQVDEILKRVQRHVLENRCRVKDFFEYFDSLNCGFVTRSQFKRGLDSIGVSGLHRLYLSENEINRLLSVFQDERDPSRVNYLDFVDKVDSVFTTKCLDKQPYTIVEVPPTEIMDLKKTGREDWQNQKSSVRELAVEAVYKIKQIISKRRLLIEPLFRDFDRSNNFHVTRTQMRQVLSMIGVLLSDEEVYSLELRYNDDLGFNYAEFLNETDPKDYAIPLFKELCDKMVKLNAPKPRPCPENKEKDIVQVLAKVKGQVVRKRIRIYDVLKGSDRMNHLCITDADFRRGLSTANIDLSENEVDLLCKIFRSPLRPCFIDHKRFCDTVDQAFYQTCLERAPLIVPLQHYPHEDGECNFLNFEERTIVSMAMQKLARHPDRISNLHEIFKDYDTTNCGTINKDQFLRALTVRGLRDLLSTREFDIVTKCFAYERGLRQEFDYRKFLRGLDLLFATKDAFPI